MKRTNRSHTLLHTPTWDDVMAAMPTPLEELHGLGGMLYNHTDSMARFVRDNQSTESRPIAGDFIRARVQPPVLTTFKYNNDGLIQGFLAGPLLVLRLHHDHESAVEIWTDPVEAIEPTIPEAALQAHRALIDTIRELKRDNPVEEFEVPQELIESYKP